MQLRLGDRQGSCTAGLAALAWDKPGHHPQDMQARYPRDGSMCYPHGMLARYLHDQ
jgi:hypothetical protein